jgi:uncharacterized protein
MRLPALIDIEMLHKKYAPTPAVFQLVFTHCHIVWSIAEQLIAKNKLQIDVELVRAGCLLHDIGVYPLFDNNGNQRDASQYIRHGILGEAILQKETLPEALWRIASHHTGVGITKLDIESQQLPLPPADYTAETLEERLVMYADKFHSKTAPPTFDTFEGYKNRLAQFGEVKVAYFEKLANEFGIPDLEPLIQKYGHTLRN